MITRKVGLKRLTKLAVYLQHEVKPKKFNLGSWARTYDDLENRIYADDALDNPQELTKKVLDTACGTTACAFGHAATMKSFRRAGLKLDIIGKYEEVSYQGELGFEAAEKFFGINYDESAYLFDPTSYNLGRQTKSYVIARIRKFVRDSEKEFS
jgi:hypothetical protein